MSETAVSRFVDPPDDAAAAQIGHALVECLTGIDALGRLRAHLVDHLGTNDVWTVDDRNRVIVACLEASDWFAGPPWVARPYDEGKTPENDRRKT